MRLIWYAYSTEVILSRVPPLVISEIFSCHPERRIRRIRCSPCIPHKLQWKFQQQSGRGGKQEHQKFLQHTTRCGQLLPSVLLRGTLSPVESTFVSCSTL